MNSLYSVRSPCRDSLPPFTECPPDLLVRSLHRSFGIHQQGDIRRRKQGEGRETEEARRLCCISGRYWRGEQGLRDEQICRRPRRGYVVCLAGDLGPCVSVADPACPARFLWLATTGIAGYASWYYKQHTISPFDDLATPSHEIQETTKDAFSSNDEYAPINRHGGGGGHHDEYEDDELESLSRGGRSASVVSSSYNGSSAYSHEQAHPGRPLSWAAEREPYAGIGGHAPIAPAHGEAAMPEAPQDYSYRGARE